MQTEQIEKLKDFCGEVDRNFIIPFEYYKWDISKLYFAKSWLKELLLELGSDYQDYKVEFYTDEMMGYNGLEGSLEIYIEKIERLIEAIINFAPDFEQSLEEHNQPIWKQIQELQRLGDKTLDDQKELFSQIKIMTYPYLQLTCQYLMEAKFQLQYKQDGTKHAG